MKRQLTTPWIDIDMTTAEPPCIRKPINIQRTMLDWPMHLIAGDHANITITTDHKDGTETAETPIFIVDRKMIVNAIVKFEVIDEFGFDVGIGFVLGQEKQGSR